MIECLDGHQDHMGLVVEFLQVFFKVVAGLIDAASVEKGEQGRLASRKLVLPGKPRAGPKAPADLCLVRSGKVLNDRRLAALSPAEQPKDRQRRMLPEPFQALLELRVFFRRGKPVTNFVKHSSSFFVCFSSLFIYGTGLRDEVAIP